MIISTPAKVTTPRVSRSQVQAHKNRVFAWLAYCCGLAGEQTLDVASYRGMDSLTTPEAAYALRVAARTTSKAVAIYGGGPTNDNQYEQGYVLCSLSSRQDPRGVIRESLLAAGFKALDTFVNPAHQSGQTMTIFGAPTLEESEVTMTD